MDKKRLQKLAGVLNEQADPNQKFFGRLIPALTRQDIYDQLRDMVQDQINDETLPEGTQFELQDVTNEIAQQYADDFVAALYNTAGERMAEAHAELLDDTLKKIKTIRRSAVAAKRQQQRSDY